MIAFRGFSPPGYLLAVMLAANAGNPSLEAQTGTLATEENFRAEPNGVLLGQLMEGTFWGVGEFTGNWVQLDLEGWVWTRSLSVVDRNGFDLVVSEEGGENLRSSPQGSVMARLEEGTLLNEVERVPGWVRVERSVWVWSESVDVSGETSAGAPRTPPAARFRRTGDGGGTLLSAPDGDTLASLSPTSDLEVLAREGNWARVRLEGWTWLPTLEDDPSEAGSSSISDATPAQVTADPGAFRGELVEWKLRFISLERAEKIRTDFYEGEPFLLTRTVTDEAVYVYVAVPPERVDEMSGLAALELVTVVGRIRVGSAALTGSPILDMLELRRAP